MSIDTCQVLYCGNENRRQSVRQAVDENGNPFLNGMDYLEISESSQSRLAIHFIHPLPGQSDGVPSGQPALTKDNIRITGGERITGIQVMSVTAAENLLTVIVDAAGDFSSYTLLLVAGPNESLPPPGFDPRLARLRFSFKAACPSPFDCGYRPDCPPELLDSPPIDYLARDYQSFRRVLLDRMRLLMPNWSETSPADFPIAMAELLAYVGDQLAYAQDANASEAYLGRARHRISVRRHARFRDYRLHEGCNARTWVQIEVEAGSAADGLVLKADRDEPTRFFAGSGADLKLAREGRFGELDARNSAIFESMESLKLQASHNRFNLYTWSDEECSLCQGATSATLIRSEEMDLKAGMVIILEEVRDPRAPRTSDLAGRQDWRHAVRLTSVQETQDVLTGTLLYEVAWAEEDALPFSFVLSRRVEDILITDITVARGNVVLADHGRSVPFAASHLVPPQAPLTGERFRPTLADANLTYREDLPLPSTVPARQCLQQDPTRAYPQAWLDSEGEEWTAVLHLIDSHGSSAEFVVEVDNDRTPHVRFGDNEYGREPAQGQSFLAGYRVGNGQSGNVGPDTVQAILNNVSGITRVRNPLPASSGIDPEAIEEARRFAPVAFQTQNRAVTLQDYEAMALRFPGIQQVRAEFRYLASWYTVVLAVDRKGGQQLDREFRSSLLRHMDHYRMAGYDLEVRDPVYVPLEITLQLCLKLGARRAAVYRELQELLGTGASGRFHPDKLSFGTRIYLSELVAIAKRVPGVSHVHVSRFRRMREPVSGLENGFLDFKALELPQLANDPSFPERGSIQFEMEGGV